MSPPRPRPAPGLVPLAIETAPGRRRRGAAAPESSALPRRVCLWAGGGTEAGRPVCLDADLGAVGAPGSAGVGGTREEGGQGCCGGRWRGRGPWEARAVPRAAADCAGPAALPKEESGDPGPHAGRAPGPWPAPLG